MIETSFAAWALILGTASVATLTGLMLARSLTWSSTARAGAIPLAFGVAVAPFLLGMSTVLLLYIFPGARHITHLLGALTLLFILSLVLLLICPDRVAKEKPEKMNRFSPEKWDWLFGALLAAWIIGLAADTLLTPLTENDSLEYATVGRFLFEQRDLSAYPALNSALNSSGFFGPWTHPPLYVSMIYLMNVIQGHADVPGMMRLIAPCFALSSATLIFTIGRLSSLTVGTIASLIFLSTPTFYLGASGGAIDALPISAMTLLYCVIISLDGGIFRRSLVQGLILGLALWTHSQALLYVPLAVIAIALSNGWQKKGESLKQVTVMLSVAGLIAAWPYGRNLKLFGTFISDTPAVFALKGLGWTEYFLMARGLDSSLDMITYGMFKGWFQPAAFSFSFWVMTLGLLTYLVQLQRQDGWWAWKRSDLISIPEPWKLPGLGIISCYLLGVATSMLLGIDLMIRNERYWLILIPSVALFGASWLYETGVRKKVTLVLAVAFLALSGQFLFVGTHKWRKLGLGFRDVLRTQGEKLKKWPEYGAVEYLRDNSRAEDMVLSLKPAVMYYTHRRMISYLDPRLLPFYREQDTNKAIKELRGLGIRYFQIPNYSLPCIYNSELQEILAREDLTTLAFSEHGNQIYEMRNPTPGIPLGSVNQASVTFFKSEIGADDIQISPVGSPLFQRELWTYLTSFGNAPVSVPKGNLTQTIGGKEYRLVLSLDGEAFVRIRLWYYDGIGHLLEQNLIGEMAISKTTGSSKFVRRFKTRSETTGVGVTIEYRGSTRIRIDHAEIDSLDS